jgi:Mrp family chromosome partitioning ATPase
VASSYRNLRATLDLGTGATPTRCVLVTSTPSSVGKGLTAAALAYAETGRRVVLIDADMDSPELHRMFGVVNGRGFAQLLAYARGLDDLVISELPQRNVRLVTAGLPDNDRTIAIVEARLRSVIESIRRDCDIIVIDGPALEDDLHPSLTLAAVADRTVLVATRGVSHLGQLASAVRHLAMVCGDTLGLVLYGASSGFDYVPVPKAETPLVDGVYVD